MDPVVELDTDRLSVEPGSSVAAMVTVKNPGNRVERYRLAVLGEAAEWARVTPEELRIDVGAEARANVVFSPPRGPDAPSGVVAFGVIASSQVQEASASAEGDLEIGELADLFATLTPVGSRGRWSAKHRVEVSNWGNTPVRLALTASDPEAQLGFLLEPDVVEVPVGATAVARLKVRARHPYVRGQPARRSFRVTSQPAAPGDEADELPAARPSQPFDPRHPAVDGTFEQKPIISRATVLAAAVLIAALGGIGWRAMNQRAEAANETVAPEAPTGFVAEAVASDAVQLSWDEDRNATSYQLLTVEPDDPEIVLGAPRPIDGQTRTDTVEGLAPGENHCFRLQAMRDDVPSPRTQPECATTPAPGELVPPSNVAAVIADDGTATVTWADNNGGQADHIVTVNGVTLPVVAAPATLLQGVPVVAGENCFTVHAVQDPRASGTAEACIEAAAAGGGASEGAVAAAGDPAGENAAEPPAGEDPGTGDQAAPPPDPQSQGGAVPPPVVVPPVPPGPANPPPVVRTERDGIVVGETGWISHRVIPAADAQSRERALLLRDEAAQLFRDRQWFVLFTGDYPQLPSPSGDSWYVYTRATDERSARDFCTEWDASQAPTNPTEAAGPPVRICDVKNLDLPGPAAPAAPAPAVPAPEAPGAPQGGS